VTMPRARSAERGKCEYRLTNVRCMIEAFNDGTISRDAGQHEYVMAVRRSYHAGRLEIDQPRLLENNRTHADWIPQRP
jgi:hypothetical protein